MCAQICRIFSGLHARRVCFGFVYLLCFLYGTWMSGAFPWVRLGSFLERSFIFNNFLASFPKMDSLHARDSQQLEVDSVSPPLFAVWLPSWARGDCQM